jgi:hypothetical protein
MSGKTNISCRTFYYRAYTLNTFKILGLGNENFRNSAMLNNGLIVVAMFGVITHVSLQALIRFWEIRRPASPENLDACCS